jgi:hypothetical protein
MRATGRFLRRRTEEMAQSKFLSPVSQLSRAPDSICQAWNYIYHIDVSMGTSSLHLGSLQTNRHINIPAHASLTSHS